MKYTNFQRELLFIKEDIEDIEDELRRSLEGSLLHNSPQVILNTLMGEELLNNDDYQHLKDKLESLFKVQITSFSLSDKITALCENRGVSIHSLEKTLGLSNGSVKRWEKQSPSLDKIVKVADFFSITIDSLIERSTSESDEQWLDSILNSYTAVKIKAKDTDTRYLSADEKRLLLYMATKFTFEDFKNI